MDYLRDSKKALELVEELNDEVYERGGFEWYVPFTFESGGYDLGVIKFMGEIVWTEYEDMREYVDEDGEVQESLRNYVLRESNKVLKDLNLKMGAF
jgi:hypothetical protein